MPVSATPLRGATPLNPVGATLAAWAAEAGAMGAGAGGVELAMAAAADGRVAHLSTFK
jgi:hypothetical protein